MKPAGLERDKQIAEMRGEHVCWGDVFIGRTPEHGFQTTECSGCGKRFQGDKGAGPKPYSTDISCAMELWEEMKQAGMTPFMLAEPGYVACDLMKRLISPTGKDCKHDAQTEADAISGAWIKWKEAK